MLEQSDSRFTLAACLFLLCWVAMDTWICAASFERKSLAYPYNAPTPNAKHNPAQPEALVYCLGFPAFTSYGLCVFRAHAISIYKFCVDDAVSRLTRFAIAALQRKE